MTGTERRIPVRTRTLRQAGIGNNGLPTRESGTPQTPGPGLQALAVISQHQARRRTRWLMRPGVAVLAIALAAAGCSAPLTVERLDPYQAYRQVNRTALSGDTPSDATLTVLRRHGLLAAWQADPAPAIASLHAAVTSQPELWPELFALSELSYLQASRDHSPPRFLAAALYAYAYLFPEPGAGRPSPYDPRFRQACDLYNLSLAAALGAPDGNLAPLAAGRRTLPFGTIDLSLDAAQLIQGGRTLAGFQPTSNLAVRGLQNIYRTPGLGAPLAAAVEANPVLPAGLRVTPQSRVPANVLLVLDAPRHQLGQPTLQGRLLIHTIPGRPEAEVGGGAVPLQYEQTTTRALGLAEAAAWDREVQGFFDGGLFEALPGGLEALQPHQHGHMPVVLVHGTASSPFRWADMVNDLLEDPAIRDHFEFWLFSYATGNPISYSALQLRQAIEGAVQQLGGARADRALGQVTVVGHSQGGLLAKMLVIDPGDRLWAGISPRPFDAVRLAPASRDLLREALFPRPLAGVRRVVFIATPQRGSYLATASVTRLLGRFVTLPLTVMKAGQDLLSGNPDILVGETAKQFGSIYSMSPRSPFIRSLAAVPVAPGVHVHSIIPVQTGGPVTAGDDGVVSYASAHIEPVESELVVQSGHSAQSNPATVAEVRRILLLQLADPG